MSERDDVTATEDRFFAALLAADGPALEALLTMDFLIIDVMTGSEAPGFAMVSLLGSGQLRFEAIERLGSRVRRYGTTAIVTGETRMRGRYGEQPFAAHSRYTHVYVRAGQGWRMASAQGTPIAPAEPA
jgi:ketosteroid isomerase-like protein